MSVLFGRFARASLIAGGIATAIALPSLVGAPLMPQNADPGARVAMAAPAAGNDNNDDPTNDNSAERNIERQVIELHDNLSPPEALVGMVGGNVWARLYNNQLQNSGVRLGDYVKMQGEYGERGMFDAYHIDVITRAGGNGNGKD